MARRKNPDLVSKTINLRRQDIEFAVRRASETSIPYQTIIRSWVAAAVDRESATSSSRHRR